MQIHYYPGAIRHIDKMLEGAPTTKSKVAVIGLGYVGLPTALALESRGHPIVGIDIDRRRLDAIRSGEVDSVSTAAHDLAGAIERGSFDLTDDPTRITSVDAVIIAVPTPIDATRTPDVAALQAACDEVVANARKGQVIILTSTTFVGCTRSYLAEPLESRGFEVGRDVMVAFAPERLNPGSTDFGPDDVPRVVGGITSECARAACEVLDDICATTHVVSSPEVAEMTKLVENTFRAVNIALANEFADAAGAFEIDAREVLDAAASKPYGFMAFEPGVGVGGHCIPCDPHYLLWSLHSERRFSPVIEQAMLVLATRPDRIAARVRELLATRGTAIDGARVLIAGITYKPGVRDLRESPALQLATTLRHWGAEVTGHDPTYMGTVVDHDGRTVPLIDRPEPGEHDLVVIAHRDAILDRDALERAPLVLDATWSLSDLPTVVTP